jgi:hypothetical protein
VVWPSRDGHFPWHSEADGGYRECQPVLGAHPQGG